MAIGWKKEYLRYRSYFLNTMSLYKKREDIKTYLEIVLSLVAISFFGFFALRPTLLTIAELLKQIENKKEIVSQMDTKIRNLQKAQNILTQEASRIKIVNFSIPSFPQPQSFMYQIESLAAQSQIQVLGINVNEVQLKGKPPESSTSTKEINTFPDGIKGMTFSINAMGTYQNIFSFLKNLENLRTPVKISVLGINISKSEEGNTLALSITGKMPYLEK